MRNCEDWLQSVVEDCSIKEIPYKEFSDKKKIKKGGFGTVFKVKCESLGDVAIKEMADTDTDTEEYRKIFINELKQHSRAKHPRVIQFYGVTIKDYRKLATSIIGGLRETPVSGTPLYFVKLYSDCWNDKPDKRPSMEEVFRRLESNSSKLDPKYNDTEQDFKENINNSDSKSDEIGLYLPTLCIDS
ncbi:10246_t:CDS:2 [Cetraspora pellucida]|uniref:10246_t:CDS:1 n=1 Tax=Cetraspora pellucida TaxID=1433469 RepID=A0A9N9GGZ0_9GLOM|nr:10246_t:CDS:2 [Cetraspora pellucida]